jgi:hypothetical protein
MTRVQDAIIRSYRDGDESKIVGLFEEVFGEPKSPERWRWQFRGHPKGASWNSVAERDGAILGHHGLMRQHLNFNGREIIAGQEVDAMIKESLRGGGFYTALGESNYTQATAGGLQALFLFPSRNSWPGSYPVIVRRLLSRRIANLHRYTKRVGYRGYVGPLDGAVRPLLRMARKIVVTVRWRGDIRGLQVETSRSIPDKSEAALKHIRDYEVLAVWKDPEYLRWRYESRPGQKYLFHGLRRDGEIHGIVVTRPFGNVLAICEVLHRRKNVAETAFLIEAVVAHARRAGLQHVEFNGFDNGFFDAAFAAAGFDVVPFSKYIFIGRVLKSGDLEAYYYNPLNWTISWGDGDEL